MPHFPRFPNAPGAQPAAASRSGLDRSRGLFSTANRLIGVLQSGKEQLSSALRPSAMGTCADVRWPELIRGNCRVYTRQTGTPIALSRSAAVRRTAGGQPDFWYKTPQEKNLAMSQKLLAQRGRRAGRKSKINLAHISFSAWDPDRYFDWLDGDIGRYHLQPMVRAFCPASVCI